MKEYIVMAIVQETIDAFDARNAPELIRCKDCKWHSEKGFCKHPNGGAGNIRPADWFCADGERKSADEKLMEEMDADPLG